MMKTVLLALFFAQAWGSYIRSRGPENASIDPVVHDALISCEGNQPSRCALETIDGCWNHRTFTKGDFKIGCGLQDPPCLVSSRRGFETCTRYFKLILVPGDTLKCICKGSKFYKDYEGKTVGNGDKTYGGFGFDPGRRL